MRYCRLNRIDRTAAFPWHNECSNLEVFSVYILRTVAETNVRYISIALSMYIYRTSTQAARSGRVAALFKATRKKSLSFGMKLLPLRLRNYLTRSRNVYECFL